MSKKKILYAIVSVGLGNLSRALAILEELPPDRYDIQFIAQGRAYQLLQPRFTTHKLEEIVYSSSGGFGPLDIIRKNFLFPVKFKNNLKTAARILDEFKPDALIVDSDFYCLHPARKRGIPIISVNSSYATVAKCLQFRRSPLHNFFSYYFIERVDAWLQEKYPDLVVCPVIEKFKTAKPKYQMVNPIVRRQFVSPANGVDEDDFKYDLAVMFGGSGIGAGDIDLRGYKGRCLALGQSEGLKLPAGAERLEYTAEPARHLAQARIIVVQGGFNSVSEVIALRKPAVIIPIKNHAEQFVNAAWAESLGFGIRAKSARALEAVHRLENNYREYKRNIVKKAPVCNGSKEAALLIQEFINGSDSHSLR